jgi:hypothetical protein
MLPGTGHRICNDCMKACVFQKQEPVNIPQIETGVLTDVLALPWGLEIYGLLTRWNPLDDRPAPRAPLQRQERARRRPRARRLHARAPPRREGFGVAGVDGLKLEPLPVELTGDLAGEARTLPRPVRDFATSTSSSTSASSSASAASASTASPSGGTRTSSPWPTSRSLGTACACTGASASAARSRSTTPGQLGFDHVALAAGAGAPRIIPLKNNLARGIRKASDFLMGLQLTGAYKARPSPTCRCACRPS